MAPFWNKLWKLQILPKVRIFAWKLAHDIVATEANLTAHHIPVNPRCVLCGFHWTNSTHTLFHCQGIKAAWKNTDWWSSLRNLRDLQPLEILFTMESKLNQ